MSQNCPYCREAISAENIAECPACHTPHHHDCWAENGGCTVFGCEHAPTDDPKISLTTPEISFRPDGLSYFVARNGSFISDIGGREGPYTLEELRQATYQGVVTAEDVVWTEGRANWIPLSQLLSAAPLLPPPLPPPLPSYHPLAGAYAPSGEPCEGIIRFGRLFYGLSLVGAIFLSALLSSLDREAAPLFPILFWLMWIPIAILRLRDVGMSGWFVLLCFVPIVNLFIWFRLLLAPRGYAITKKPDTTMRVLFWICISLFVAAVGLVIIGSASK